MKKYLPVLVLLFFFSSSAFAAKYIAMPGFFQAKIELVEKGGKKTTDNFGNATGDFQFDPSSNTLNKFRFGLDTSNLDGIAEKLFDKSPEITFQGTKDAIFKDNKAEITGSLTINGTSRPVTLSAQLNDADSEKVNVTIETVIKRSAYILNSDDLEEDIKLILDISARNYGY